MIRSLRKKHHHVWMLLIFLLPVAIVIAVASRRTLPSENALAENHVLLPLLLNEAKWRGNTIQLRRGDNELERQIAWLNKEPLTFPIVAVYMAWWEGASPESAEFLGRVETRGLYTFPVATRDQYHLIVYDPVRQRILHRIIL
jgi:hypothetical protein